MSAASDIITRSEGASPAIAQWFALKAEQPEALLFFRMGDFFELFFEDAEAAAAALDIQLSARGEHAGVPIPMCGVPVTTAEIYLPRLIRAGFRVAVAEQMEAAATRAGKAPLARAIVRLITPGTLTEDTLLDGRRPNLLLAIAASATLGDPLGVAWLEISTGLFETEPVAPAGLPALLARLDPAEILAPPELPLAEWASRRAPEQRRLPPAEARRLFEAQAGTATLDALGSFSAAEIAAAAAALDYVQLTQAGRMPRLGRPRPAGGSDRLQLDAATRASLEITTARDGTTRHTLLAAVDRTGSAAGARTLATWLAAPLTDAAAIARRQDAWSHLAALPAGESATLRRLLKLCPDLARALGRLSLDRATPRDLAAVRDALAVADLAATTLPNPPECLATLVGALRPAPNLATRLRDALVEAPPPRFEDGGVIAPGYDGELAAERALRDEGRQAIPRLQLDYAQRFGVAALKIRHHAQLGYVLEAPTAAVETLRARPELSLRQGMANGARFQLAELTELDRRITEAGDRAAARERAIVADLATACLAAAAPLAACAEALAELDALLCCAELAQRPDWCRPTVTPDQAFQVTRLRHPMVEAASRGRAAVQPNDCDLSPERRMMLLTGPNMAGKSTFLRQNALAIVLAQAGLPLPAASATIGIADRLFSRVGGADDLARGRSTFMVEMTEAAAILNQAGPRSFVVIDEIGRGTSTLDGLAIAWAVLEALHATLRCRTIFATHFHELASLGATLPRLRAATMRVKEWQGELVFLHEVGEGAARRSWGVHVARLAGVPAAVVRRAAALLANLERTPRALEAELPLFAHLATPTEPEAPSAVSETLELALAAIDPDALTPREALAALYRLKALQRDSKEGRPEALPLDSAGA